MTRKQLENRVNVLAELLAVARTPEQAETMNQDRFLSIDYAQCYGGYQLVFIKLSNYAEYSFRGMGRMSNKDFSRYLEGAINGIALLNQLNDERKQ